MINEENINVASSVVIEPTETQNYVIPLRYRQMENLHIVF